ncbi:hypothetical protein HSR122_2790 [Halapricum desulfuricans]|uniref:Uncharacterized protein n=1 Tax=Halapricum desulfuricans TaxID=2841257 RepID=A0A897NCM8_9EURY|nr:hypothetical protein HSR122_2790 [Halapricum desulfuricans]
MREAAARAANIVSEQDRLRVVQIAPGPYFYREQNRERLLYVAEAICTLEVAARTK